jgi:hypothetical protein
MTTEPQPQQRKIDGNHEYEGALDTLFAQTGRTLRIFDRSLGGDYNSQHRHELLRSFLRASRDARIRIVLHDASNLVRDCPRIINLVRDFSHAVSINETQAEAKGVYDPFSVIDERHYVHRFHYEQPRGLLALDDPQSANGFVKRFEEIWEASTPAVSATTLGL